MRPVIVDPSATDPVTASEEVPNATLMSIMLCLCCALLMVAPAMAKGKGRHAYGQGRIDGALETASTPGRAAQNAASLAAVERPRPRVDGARQARDGIRGTAEIKTLDGRPIYLSGIPGAPQ